MRIAFVAAALALSASNAFSLTPPETNAVLATVAKSSKVFHDCLRQQGDKVQQTIDAKDINGDGIEEVVVTETADQAATACFGRTGQVATLLASDGAGGWKTLIDVHAHSFQFIKRTDSPWPDVEIGGPGFCFPIWRMQESKRQYDIWRTCENGKLVDAKPTTATQVASTSTIGTQVPVEIYKGPPLSGPPYDHNGSIVLVDAEKGLIVYDKPKKSIAGTIKPGTVLFRGAPWKDGDPDTVIKGTAYVFKKDCPAAAYDVRGLYHHAFGISQFTLEGGAPVRSKTSCDIVGHSTTNGNSKLKFDIAIE